MIQAATVAVLDGDEAHVRSLAGALAARGDLVQAFGALDDSTLDRLLAEPALEALVIDPAVAPPRSQSLIAALHERGTVGIVAWTSAPSGAEVSALAACGADLVLAKPLPPCEAMLAIDLVRGPRADVHTPQATWRLEHPAGRGWLIAPNGTPVHVSDADRRLLECFARSASSVVGRERLRQVVGRDPEVDLNACMYRLRRRITSAAGMPLPLRSKFGQGYVFSAEIEVE